MICLILGRSGARVASFGRTLKGGVLSTKSIGQGRSPRSTDRLESSGFELATKLWIMCLFGPVLSYSAWRGLKSAFFHAARAASYMKVRGRSNTKWSKTWDMMAG